MWMLHRLLQRQEKGVLPKPTELLTVLPHLVVYAYIRRPSPPLQLTGEKPSLNHNLYDLCTRCFYYCSLLLHPLCLFTPGGIPRSLTQLHWSPFFPHAALPAAPHDCQEFFFGSVRSCAHGLWSCTVEWFIRYRTLQKGLSPPPPMAHTHINRLQILTCRFLLFLSLNSLKHSELLREPCFLVWNLYSCYWLTCVVALFDKW